MKIGDLAGLGGPLERLIEVVSFGIGTVHRPNLIKREADAKAYEIEKISGALKRVADDHQLPVIYKDGQIEIWQKPEDRTLVLSDIGTAERSQSRVEYQERKRQHNIESVTSSAAADLMDISEVPEQSPDEDWVTRFFANAQDVSSEGMQELWGRILAGEIKKPGSYSLRTLDFIRNLKKSDAELFTRLAKLAYITFGASS